MLMMHVGLFILDPSFQHPQKGGILHTPSGRLQVTRPVAVAELELRSRQLYRRALLLPNALHDGRPQDALERETREPWLVGVFRERG